ncbi:uncharacterized protein BXZ73DRAFT_108333 [Epithele typhae]|uniref:uncharacterized protein n=1 Tax=Epithele typhae TaxID=378194 RepID=UPI002008DBAB|nr:uncharacterized protein BXZ73DRAFT_108333 [Epithele typhae]KAH9910969.1 hypothetical protein BXZ73DRAFT_108333 [Epithele typhae]
MSANPSSPSQGSRVPTPSGPPFDKPSTNLIIRSSDLVDFRVHQHILAEASPVFADMLTLPQPREQERDLLPVVDVAEDAQTWRYLLFLCYPTNKQNFSKLEDTIPVIKAAQKYEMEWPVTYMIDKLRAGAHLRPLFVWVIGVRCHLEQTQQYAAAAMRGTGLPNLESMLQSEGFGILEGTTAGQYFHLRQDIKVKFSIDWLFGQRTPRQAHPPVQTNQTPVPFSASPTDCASNFIPDDPPADCTLQCLGGAVFHVHHLILKLHAPSLVKTTAPGSTVHIDMDPGTAEEVLRFFYTCGDALTADLARLSAVLSVAQRTPLPSLAKAAEACWRRLAAATPLDAYLHGARYKLGANLLRIAARHTLSKRLEGVYTSAMDAAPARAYHHLLTYHAACARAVAAKYTLAAARWREALAAVLAAPSAVARPPAPAPAPTIPADSIADFYASPAPQATRTARPPATRTPESVLKTAETWLCALLERDGKAVAEGTRAPWAPVASAYAAGALLASPEAQAQAWPPARAGHLAGLVRAVGEVAATLQTEIDGAIDGVTLEV